MLEQGGEHSGYHHRLGLLDDDPERRAAAVAAAPAGLTTWYLLRSLLLFDASAAVRSRAALRLHDAAGQVPAADWLVEALRDPCPSVREAACRSLGRLRAGVAALQAASLQEPVWWVRRAAVKALRHAAGEGALPTLLQVLEDPFWRVRDTALRALRSLGGLPGRRGEPTLEGGPVRSSALSFLQGAPASAAATRPLPPPDLLGIVNADPAVTTARLEQVGGRAPATLLVQLLAEAHQPLRQLAAELLLASEDLAALGLALRHLDDPRAPNAPEAVRWLLGQLDWTMASELVPVALGPLGNAPAAVWALHWIVEHQEESLYQRLSLALRTDPRPAVRAGAAAAAAGLGADGMPAQLGEALRLALQDPDAAVRSAAVTALVADPGSYPVLAAVTGSGLNLLARRALLEAAAVAGDTAALLAATVDPHPYLRALALERLDAAGALPEELRQQASRDLDPWPRTAVLDAAGAIRALESDPDPQVRRAALDLTVRSRQRWPAELCRAAGRQAAIAADPYLRSRGAALLDADDLDDLELLLQLSRDAQPAVSAAALDPLQRSAALASALRRLLARPGLGEPLTRAAWSELSRERTPAVAAELAAALATAEGEGHAWLAEHLRALILVLPEELVASLPELEVRRPVPRPMVEAPASSATRAEPVLPAAPRRRLGRTGLSVSPLGLSGAYQLSTAALAEAHQAGVNLFFWEPHYLTLTRFVREQRRRRDQLVLVGGSFHGSAAAVEADLDTALRRLRTDHLDLFLLYWVRSPERLSEELHLRLCKLRAAGKVRAIGFSTHHRELAAQAIQEQSWDAVMVRHNAAHTGAERELLPLALERGVGVLTFSALCYGRLLRRWPGMAAELSPPSAADCYRYTLSQPGVTACLSAPRRRWELQENLAVVRRPLLTGAEIDALRAHGTRVYEESRRFNALVRQAGRVSDLRGEEDWSEEQLESLEATEPLPAACEAELCPAEPGQAAQPLLRDSIWSES